MTSPWNLVYPRFAFSLGAGKPLRLIGLLLCFSLRKQYRNLFINLLFIEGRLEHVAEIHESYKEVHAAWVAW